MGNHTASEQVRDRQRFEDLYAAQLDSMIRFVKEQIRLRGYWVSRELMKWDPDPIGSRVVGAARDPWLLDYHRSDVVLRIEPAGQPMVDVTFFIVGPGEWEDRKILDILAVKCRSEHPEVGRILASIDLKEVVRRLTWHLKYLSPPPSPRHWWPQKKTPASGGIAVGDITVPGARPAQQNRG